MPGVQDLGPGTWRGPTVTPPPVASRQRHRLLPGTFLAFCSPSRPETAHRYHITLGNMSEATWKMRLPTIHDHYVSKRAKKENKGHKYGKCYVKMYYFCNPPPSRPRCPTHTHTSSLPSRGLLQHRAGTGGTGTPLLQGFPSAAGILESYCKAPGTLLQGLGHYYRLLTVQASAVQPLAGCISEATWFFLQSSDMSFSNCLNPN